MVINGIDTKDISVVVQGAVNETITPLCLKSIRKCLPEAEIILSTWIGSRTDGLDYDQLVLSDDPGGMYFNNNEAPANDNMNRQLVSTMSGLRYAKKIYTVKMRTDFLLETAEFLEWFDKYPKQNSSYSFFQHKVICSDIYSRNPRFECYGYHFVCHPSDFFFFGLTDDLLDLYDIPLIPENDQIYFSRKYPDRFVDVLPRFFGEQHLWVSFLRKHMSDQNLPQDSEDVSPDTVRLSETTFAANLIMLSKEQIGLRCGKVGVYGHLPQTCFSHFDWLCLYLHFCRKFFFPYAFYLLKCFLIDKWLRLKNPFPKFHKKIHGFLLEKVAPWLTPSQKVQLKPAYHKLKSLYHKLRPQRALKNYEESYFNEAVTAQNLSVVLQGAVSNATKECIESVRKWLPNAEIILSTWENSNVEGLDYDKLVLSIDPGPSGLIRRFPMKHINNIERQIVSSRAGVQVAARRYCMKIRTDMLITSTGFLTYYNRYSQYVALDALVSRRIMVDGLSTSKDALFALSDWWYLGLTEDLKRLFNAPPYPSEDIPYFERPENKTKHVPFSDCIARFFPEAYITYNFIKKYSPRPIAQALNCEHCFDSSPAIVESYRKLLSGSFLCIESTRSGVILPKARDRTNPQAYNYNMAFANWVNLCKADRTIPKSVHEPVLENECALQKAEYMSAYHYYDIFNYATIVQNYAKFDNRRNFVAAIDKADITFVVSGDIILDGDLNTHHCLVSIRRFFPKSRIILSTWDEKPLGRLKGLYDQLVLLPKPAENAGGRIQSDALKEKHSFNMEQRCVHAGMKEVRTKYAVRMRPDFYLFNDLFLPFYIKWSAVLSQREASYAIFRQRILSLKLFTYDPRCGYSYSLSNHFQFGLTEDLLLLWDGHQEMLGSLTYFERQPAYKPENPAGVSHRYMAEQYFLLNVVQKAKPKLPYPQYYFDRSDDRFAFETEKIYASNVLIGNNSQLGIASGFDDRNVAGVYTLERLLEIYLYNVEPDNQQCLDHLKEAYRPQEVKKSWKDSFVLLPFRLLLLFVKTVLRAAYRGVKAVLRIILPGYRTAHGVRDRLIAQEQAEQARYDHLISRINQLEQALAQKDVQHTSVGSKRRPKRRRLH